MGFGTSIVLAGAFRSTPWVADMLSEPLPPGHDKQQIVNKFLECVAEKPVIEYRQKNGFPMENTFMENWTFGGAWFPWRATIIGNGDNQAHDTFAIGQAVCEILQNRAPGLAINTLAIYTLAAMIFSFVLPVSLGMILATPIAIGAAAIISQRLESDVDERLSYILDHKDLKAGIKWLSQQRCSNKRDYLEARRNGFSLSITNYFDQFIYTKEGDSRFDIFHASLSERIERLSKGLPLEDQVELEVGNGVQEASIHAEHQANRVWNWITGLFD